MSTVVSSSQKSSPAFSRRTGNSNYTSHSCMCTFNISYIVRVRVLFVRGNTVGVSIASAAAKDSVRLTKHAVLPPITSPPPDDGHSTILSVRDDEPSGNPFSMPPTSEVFTLRERERQQNRQERAKERKLKVNTLKLNGTTRPSHISFIT